MRIIPHIITNIDSFFRTLMHKDILLNPSFLNAVGDLGKNRRCRQIMHRMSTQPNSTMIRNRTKLYYHTVFNIRICSNIRMRTSHSTLRHNTSINISRPIHPKTLKPLQNKHIPLYVKSFFKPENEGSVINDSPLKKKIPSYIIKENQRIITLFPRDFSFIAVDSLSEIFDVLSRHRVKINMMQNSALSFSICTDNDEVRLKPCIAELNKNFKVKYNEGIELITIRHYTPISIASILQHREVILQQTSRTTTQYAVK